MTDIKKSPRAYPDTPGLAGSSLLFLRDDELRQGIELLYFAYRDFTGDPDQVLRQFGFGRAHHRVIHFVGRRPGQSVSDLLDTLRITKQSLSRVLKQLVEDGYISSKPDKNDRRKRNLRLTEKGQALEDQLSSLQRARVAKAYREAGPEAVAGWRRVLLGLIDNDRQNDILEFVKDD